jgi:probable addiction module antidote protein
VEPSVDYQPFLLESLRNPAEAAAFINLAIKDALVDNDMPLFLLCLRDVVEAQGGMTKVARLAGINRENLYRILSKDGNPEFRRLTQLLSAMGLRITISPKTAVRSGASSSQRETARTMSARRASWRAPKRSAHSL